MLIDHEEAQRFIDMMTRQLGTQKTLTAEMMGNQARALGEFFNAPVVLYPLFVKGTEPALPDRYIVHGYIVKPCHTIAVAEKLEVGLVSDCERHDSLLRVLFSVRLQVAFERVVEPYAGHENTEDLRDRLARALTREGIRLVREHKPRLDPDFMTAGQARDLGFDLAEDIGDDEPVEIRAEVTKDDHGRLVMNVGAFRK